MAITAPFTLFQNKTFYLSKAVPNRVSLEEKVLVNGGRIATLCSADYIVSNPCHPYPLANSISYEFIEEAAANGKLPDIDKHAVTAVPPGLSPPRKRRKLRETASTRPQQGSNDEGARLGPDNGTDPECIVVSDERPRRNPNARHVKIEEAEGEALEEGAAFRCKKGLLKQIREVEEVSKKYQGNLDLIVKGGSQVTLVAENVARLGAAFVKANEKLIAQLKKFGPETAEQQARARTQATNTKPQLKANVMSDGRKVVRSGRGWYEVERSLTPETKSQDSRYVERGSNYRRCESSDVPRRLVRCLIEMMR